MPKFVVKSGTVVINGVDLSSHVKQIDVKRAKAKIDATGLNGNGAMEWVPGLADEELTLTIMSDFDPGAVDDTLNPLYEGELPFPVLVRPFAGAASADNPEYSCEIARLFDYNPISGAVGALSETQVTITANGGFTRTT